MMNNILDFLNAAMPWIAIGLLIAVFAVRQNEIKEVGEKEARVSKSRKLVYLPIVAMFIACIFFYIDGDARTASTWFIIGLASFVFTNMDSKRAEK